MIIYGQAGSSCGGVNEVWCKVVAPLASFGKEALCPSEREGLSSLIDQPQRRRKCEKHKLKASTGERNASDGTAVVSCS